MNEKKDKTSSSKGVVNAKMLYHFYVLKELSNGKEIYGNQILETFKVKLTNAAQPFSVSSSVVYSTLYDLESNGYIISHWEGDDFIGKRSKKLYSITAKGREYYKDNVFEYLEGLENTKRSLDILIDLLIH